MHFHRSCRFHQPSHSCWLHRSIQWSTLFDNSLSHNQGHHTHRILEPRKKIWYFAASSRLWILECLQNYDILTEGGIDSRQANNPLCWTRKRFDVRTSAVDAVSLTVSLLFRKWRFRFSWSVIQAYRLPYAEVAWLTATHHEPLATPLQWRHGQNVTK